MRAAARIASLAQAGASTWIRSRSRAGRCCAYRLVEPDGDVVLVPESVDPLDGELLDGELLGELLVP